MTSDYTRQAAGMAMSIQDASNIIAVAGEFHHYLRERRLPSDDLARDPITLVLISKLVSLSGFNAERESDAFQRVAELAQ